MAKKLFSIVIPIYKNELNLPVTVPYLINSIPELFPNYDVELIMVNDGSPDNSWELMKAYQALHPDVIRIASFSRNFGQAMAIHYGISIARGDAIGVISADLQDPFEMFATMLVEWENGNELVCAIRESRQDKGIGTLFSKITHRLIRRFINSAYPKGGFDFFLMDRKVASHYIAIEERNGSPQLLLLWLGYRTKFLPYIRRQREVGKSSWTVAKKIKAFIDSFVTNTYLPVRVMSVTGALCAIGAFLYAAVIIISSLLMERVVVGWSSLATLIIFFGGLILASLGLIGEYLWRIFDAVKRRPLYLVDEVIDNKSEKIKSDER